MRRSSRVRQVSSNSANFPQTGLDANSLPDTAIVQVKSPDMPKFYILQDSINSSLKTINGRPEKIHFQVKDVAFPIQIRQFISPLASTNGIPTRHQDKRSSNGAHYTSKNSKAQHRSPTQQPRRSQRIYSSTSNRTDTQSSFAPQLESQSLREQSLIDTEVRDNLEDQQPVNVTNTRHGSEESGRSAALCADDTQFNTVEPKSFSWRDIRFKYDLVLHPSGKQVAFNSPMSISIDYVEEHSSSTNNYKIDQSNTNNNRSYDDDGDEDYQERSHEEIAKLTGAEGINLQVRLHVLTSHFQSSEFCIQIHIILDNVEYPMWVSEPIRCVSKSDNAKKLALNPALSPSSRASFMTSEMLLSDNLSSVRKNQQKKKNAGTELFEILDKLMEMASQQKRIAKALNERSGMFSNNGTSLDNQSNTKKRKTSTETSSPPQRSFSHGLHLENSKLSTNELKIEPAQKRLKQFESEDHTPFPMSSAHLNHQTARFEELVGEFLKAYNDMNAPEASASLAAFVSCQPDLQMAIKKMLGKPLSTHPLQTHSSQLNQDIHLLSHPTDSYQPSLIHSTNDLYNLAECQRYEGAFADGESYVNTWNSGLLSSNFNPPAVLVSHNLNGDHSDEDSFTTTISTPSSESWEEESNESLLHVPNLTNGWTDLNHSDFKSFFAMPQSQQS